MFKALLKDCKKHHLQYLVLLSGLSLGLFGFFSFVGLPFWRLASVLFLGLFYFLWGMAHHLLAHDWHIKIALEYLLISVIGCGLLLSIVLRS